MNSANRLLKRIQTRNALDSNEKRQQKKDLKKQQTEAARRTLNGMIFLIVV